MWRRVVFTLTCVMFIASCHCAAEIDIAKEIGPLDQRTIKVHFKLPKTEYLVAEPIFLSIGMENYGSKVQYYQAHEEWLLNIRDEQGKPAKFVGLPQEERMNDEFVPGVGGAGWGAIKPMSTAGGSRRNLLDYYGDGQGSYDFYLRAGIYTITANQLPSDTISFRVVWPSSSEDSIAVNTLIYAADNAYTMLSPVEQRYRFFSDFVAKFPNSVYTPRALRRLLATSTVETPIYDESKKQYYVRYMLTKFPESEFAFRALEALDIRSVPSQEKVRVVEGLRKLKAALSAEDLRRRADELIGKLEK